MTENQKTLYIGIDVSKETLDTSTSLFGKNILASIVTENNLTGFTKLHNGVKDQAVRHNCTDLHYCMEATGIYYKQVAKYLSKQENTRVSIINPYQAKAFAESELVRTKTDKHDSKMLACYCALKKPRRSYELPKEIERLRELVRYLNFLIRERAKQKTKLESVQNKEIFNLIKKTIAFYDKQIIKAENLIKKLVMNTTSLKEKVELLDSIKGVAERTAWVIISELFYTDEEKLDCKIQLAHAGLAPAEKRSGKSVRGRAKICKKGNKRIRAALYMPSMSALLNNPVIKEFYERLISKGKNKMLALIASIAKLLKIAIGVLNNKTPFDPDWSKKYCPLTINT